MKTNVLPFLAAGCVLVLIAFGIVALLSASATPAGITSLTLICGGNATVNMTVQGTALLSVAALRRSNCSAQVSGSSVVIQCPAQDISRYLGEHSAIASVTSTRQRIG
jgi:hypothetical protein